MANSLDDRLDRYLAGELTPHEQRELAQAALDDPSLFDTLTAAALAKAASRESDRVPSTETPARRLWTRARLAVLAAGAMAAAAVTAIAIVGRPSHRTDALPPQASAGARSSAASEKAPAQAQASPVFLTARNEPQPDRSSPAFRAAAESGGRLPKDVGAVVSVNGDDVEVDVGSLDGIAKGSTARVFRGSGAAPVATLLVTTVFRERSRGQTTSGAVALVGDKVEVGHTDSVHALMQQAAARTAAGDVARARQLAELAIARAESNDVTPALRRRALYQLGVLEHAAGALDEAALHLRRATDAFDQQPVAASQERADVLNELGAILIERQDYAEAERVLRVAPRSAGVAGLHIANNLAALAAMRGDRATAEALYRSALDLAGTASELEAERRVIRSNLDRLPSPR
ncbi:MAG TPA: tetratricopeptide repeat protein [Vicinamibacterales bacterium]|nr:tetratricopeptide repeat protein [Vicinamibacterales bacterium]